MEPKLSVSTDKELLRIGADVVDLRDESTATYHTEDLGEFIRFAGDKSATEHVIFYSAELVSLFAAEVFAKPREYDAVAVCKMAVHPRLAILLKANGRKMDADDFETLMRQLKRNLDGKGLELLDNINNLTVSKATKIERKKDRGGNYRYSVSRESAGTEDFQPPESLAFKVPLFVGVESPRPLEFDFRFDFTQKDGDVALFFTIECLNLTEDLIYARASVLAEALAALEIKSLRGTLERKIRDDSWSKKINGINL